MVEPKWNVQTLNTAKHPIQEFIGQIIDIFEDFLDDRGIVLDNPERDEDEDLNPEEAANIFGSDYGDLQSEIEDTLENWGIIEREYTMICGMKDGCDGCLLQHVHDIERCKNMKWD